MAKKQKVLLALLLVLVMVMSAACGVSDEVKEPASVNGDSSVNGGTQGDNNSGNSTEAPADVEITLAETVLYDADGIKITATGFEDGFMGPEVKLLLENESGKNILVTADAVSVNGYMMPLTGLYAEVATGKKANESITFMSSELEQSGIETVAEIQFYLLIQDPETWETKVKTELLTLTTSAAPYEQPVDDSGDVLYEADGIKVVCKGLKQDIIWDGTVVFYLENNTGKAISIYAENVSVNGFMQDVGLWSDLRAGTKLIDGMSMIDLSDIEVEDINQIENIEFNLRVVDAETWNEIVTTDAMTLTFE